MSIGFIAGAVASLSTFVVAIVFSRSVPSSRSARRVRAALFLLGVAFAAKAMFAESWRGELMVLVGLSQLVLVVAFGFWIYPQIVASRGRSKAAATDRVPD